MAYTLCLARGARGGRKTHRKHIEDWHGHMCLDILYMYDMHGVRRFRIPSSVTMVEKTGVPGTNFIHSMARVSM